MSVSRNRGCAFEHPCFQKVSVGLGQISCKGSLLLCYPYHSAYRSYLPEAFPYSLAWFVNLDTRGYVFAVSSYMIQLSCMSAFMSEALYIIA